MCVCVLRLTNFAATDVFLLYQICFKLRHDFFLLFFLRTPSVFASSSSSSSSSHPTCSVATGTVLVLMSFLNFQQPLKLITRLSNGGLLSAGSERELQAALLAC